MWPRTTGNEDRHRPMRHWRGRNSDFKCRCSLASHFLHHLSYVLSLLYVLSLSFICDVNVAICLEPHTLFSHDFGLNLAADFNSSCILAYLYLNIYACLYFFVIYIERFVSVTL